MKICYLTYGVNPKTGWGKLATHFVNGAREEGHEVIILKEHDDGFEGYPILKRGAGIVMSVIRTRRHIKNCDIVHVFDVYPYGIIAYLASRFLNTKLVLTGVGTYSVAPLYRPRTAWIAKKVLHASDAITAISEYTKSEMLKKIDGMNIEVIHIGVKYDDFYIMRSEGKIPIVLSVGVLKHRKGYHVAIPAFAKVLQTFPIAKYLIIGYQQDTVYFKRLKDLAAKHGVSESIEFMENVSHEDLRRFYSTSHVFVQTSVNDDVSHHFCGYSLGLVEAAAAGLPVVASSGNGIQDAVNSGENGILVPQNDIEKTANAIIAVLGDEDLRSRMSDASYAFAKSQSVSFMVSSYLKIYDSIVS